MNPLPRAKQLLGSSLQWLDKILREKDRFCLPNGLPNLPSCLVRPIVESDLASCEAIYRLNEPGRFPEGYFPYFSDWLRQKKSLVLVAESAGKVRGFGGVMQYVHPKLKLAALTFGMVHPQDHRQGYGTALLLARLSLFTEPSDHWAVFISTTGGSESFYGRFGFRSVGRLPGDGGEILDSYRMRLYRRDWRTCRALAAPILSADLSAAMVPAIPLPEVMPRSRTNS